MGGAGLRMIHLPCIGDEATVAFLDGCPDRPIITGFVTNGLNRPQWKLPENQAPSGLCSRDLDRRAGKPDSRRRYAGQAPGAGGERPCAVAACRWI